VLFPLDPGDDAFVRGGETREIRGRGDREAFSIDEREGAGLCSPPAGDTIQVRRVRARGSWDYRVLTARDAGGDKNRRYSTSSSAWCPTATSTTERGNYTVASPRAY